MPKPDLNPINLGSVARGAAIELFDKAMAKVTASIADKTTDATAPREIVLKFKFKPDEDRRSAQLFTTETTKLPGTEEHISKVYFGKDEGGNSYAFDSDPRQEVLFQPPEKETNLVQFSAQE